MAYVLDFETRSLCDLKRAGAYRYALDPSTVILCLAWGAPGEDTELWWPGEPFPAPLRAAAEAGGPFHAHNAVFERLIWNHVLRQYEPTLPELPPAAWECSMARAAAAGWPLGLKLLGDAMGLDVRKDARGTLLINACSNAAKPWPAQVMLDSLGDYCLQDVRTETEALLRTPALSAPERRVWLLDQTINDRGVRIDTESLAAMQGMLRVADKEAAERLNEITRGSVDKPTKAAALRDWCEAQGVTLPDLRKETVEAALQRPLPPQVAEALRIRIDAGGAAVKKLRAFEDCVGFDGRARGLLQYHAAGTGRWGGRLIQPQNFPRPTEKVDPGIFLTHTADQIAAIHGGVYSAVSNALRGLIWAAPGHTIRRADLNAIEARALLWLAGHEDAVAVLRAGCIYCEMATTIYGRRIVKGVDDLERFVGKVTVLGCGYQMGATRFVEHAASFGLTFSLLEADKIVRSYRSRWHKVPELWWGLEAAVRRAVTRGGKHEFRGVEFVMHEGALLCRIPSGRVLRWQGIEVEQDDDGRVQVFARKVHQNRWVPVSLYGGIITERVVQALARDVMVHGMFLAEKEGLPVVLTVHDELVTEPPISGAGVKVLEQCLEAVPRWAPGLPLKAEGVEGERYGK